ncbi:nitrite reductase (NAD(P)H) small subunit [Escherichia coli]|uniref:Nitrite reductase (NAD(P)H) small subunit n=1 Tax=Escherichia coli TaxID=562 RepID=A0A447X514_ECOLX|nr:nitrite reductase (NAD(P)H) small subunit [Escherichia coli]
MSQWKDICKIDDILPETGVCALLGDEQVAIFRPYHSDQVFAITTLIRSSSPACCHAG